MSRAAVLLLIAALFLCPMRCMGGIGKSTADEPAGCRCKKCRTLTDHARPNSDLPSDPDSNCPCGNCLCNGAVFNAPSHDLTIETTPAVIALFEASSDVPAPCVAWDATLAAKHLPLSGRERKVALRALLI